ncbi:MAG: hypothetical protein M0O93_01915 [Bacteroidales bacterium]|nr:hypothetical protein [Bacteroidales bacterium]
MKLKLLTLILLLTSSIFLNAQDNNQSKLIGGMYFHSGYLNNINDLSYGLGGKLSFKLNNYLRIGTEGYGSSSEFKNDGSFYSIGWGGVLGEFIFYNKKKTNLIIGLTFGGAVNKQMDIIKNNKEIRVPDIVFWRKESSLIISPFLSFEYAISKKANLSMKFDYLLSPTNEIFNSGLRVYIGCLFNMIG